MIYAIDPGTRTSGVVHLRVAPEFKVLVADKARAQNIVECDLMSLDAKTHVVIEDIRYAFSRGQSSGIDEGTTQTIKNIGRFQFAAELADIPPVLIPRPDVKLILTGRTSSTDAEVSSRVKEILSTITGVPVAALKGTKRDPGPCYGVASHSWQALAAALAAHWEETFKGLYLSRLG